MDASSSSVRKEIELREILLALLKWSWLLVVFAGAGGWIGYNRAKKVPNQYQSSAVLVLANSGLQKGEVGSIGDQTVATPDLALFQSLLTSKVVLSRVLAQKIRRSPEFREETIAELLHADTGNPVSVVQTVQYLANRMSVLDQGDGTLKVSYHSANAELCPAIVDMTISIAQDQLKSIRLGRLDMVIEQVRRSVENAHSRFQAASLSVVRFKNANIAMESADLQARLADLESEMGIQQEEYLTLRKRMNQLLIERDQVLVPAIVFDPANRPATLIGPDRWHQAQLAGFIGLVLGLVIVGAWEFLLRKKP